jgi:hypothetical protein
LSSPQLSQESSNPKKPKHFFFENSWPFSYAQSGKIELVNKESPAIAPGFRI